MIKSITVTNPRGESLEMVLTNPEKSGFVIANITGLEPPQATINSTELSVGDGSIFNSARANTRNIVLTIGFLPNPTIEHSRQKLYKYFPIKNKVRLTITTDIKTCYIDGYVETNEAEIFAQQTATQISIICPDPALRNIIGDETIFSGTTDVFEFPMENDGVEFVIEDPMEFSILHLDDIVNVPYSGEIDTGCKFVIDILDPISNLRIWDYYGAGDIKINIAKVSQVIGATVDTGDQIIISTIPGQKEIVCIHNGQSYNILNCINKDALWIQLTMGNNVICYALDDPSTRFNLQMRIENPVLLQGV